MIRPALALFLTLSASAQDTPFAEVLAELEKIHSETGLRNASLGFAMIPLEAESPSSLAGYRPDTALLPASALKAVTTATALDLLGPDFRFETTLQFTGTIGEDGALHGDVLVTGGGDPTLGAAQTGKLFSGWQEALKKAGIKKIDGRVIGDASLFGSQLRPDPWQWNDLGNYYAAGACGLTFHRNQFVCRFQTGEPGTAAKFLGTDPKMPELTFVNEMRVGAAGSGDHGYVYGAPYTSHLYLRGTVPAGGSSFAIRGALPDPSFFCARAFTAHLREKKFEVSGEPSTVRLLNIAGEKVDAERKDLLSQKSDPLSMLIIPTNHRSNNLYAECIHRMIGVNKSNDGSTVAAARAVTAHWKEKGIDLTGFHMADGSGLARTNTVTARQMTLILYHAAKSTHFAAFSKSLPIAGQSGTMRFIGRGTASEGRVRSKSGSMDRVKSYCGYIQAKSGERYAFALFLNSFTGDPGLLKPKIVRVWNKIIAHSPK